MILSSLSLLFFVCVCEQAHGLHHEKVHHVKIWSHLQYIVVICSHCVPRNYSDDKGLDKITISCAVDVVKLQ